MFLFYIGRTTLCVPRLAVVLTVLLASCDKIPGHKGKTYAHVKLQDLQSMEPFAATVEWVDVLDTHDPNSLGIVGWVLPDGRRQMVLVSPVTSNDVVFFRSFREGLVYQFPDALTNHPTEYRKPH